MGDNAQRTLETEDSAVQDFLFVLPPSSLHSLSNGRPCRMAAAELGKPLMRAASSVRATGGALAAAEATSLRQFCAAARFDCSPR